MEAKTLKGVKKGNIDFFFKDRALPWGVPMRIAAKEIKEMLKMSANTFSPHPQKQSPKVLNTPLRN